MDASLYFTEGILFCFYLNSFVVIVVDIFGNCYLKFFNNELDNKFSINHYFTGQGFTATIDEGVFGTGEMVLESTGKDTLPLCAENYVTYRYTVDKDCNFELFKIYDEVK